MTRLEDATLDVFIDAFPSTKRGELMVAHTYLKIGGLARAYVEADSADVLVSMVDFAIQNKIPWVVIGGGSNVLVSDEGFEGVVIHANDRGCLIDGTTVRCAAGAFTGAVARACADAGLIGFEWGVGVPGTIGGAIYGDAGCFGGEMRDVVKNVDVYDVTRRIRRTYSCEECHFEYRESRFKHEPFVILRTTLELVRGDRDLAMQKITDIMSKRKETQPQGAFSAGCLFKNFTFTNREELAGLEREMTVPTAMIESRSIPAGWLVDQLGLKGTTIGKAQVSPAHGNFLVNLGGARAQDVIALSSLVKMKIRDAYGILLEDEVQYVGFGN